MIEYRHNKISGIYMIRSCMNGKIYIGSAKDLFLRMHVHKSQLNGKYHPNIHLQRHKNKYGINDLMFFLIEYCDLENIVEREQYWMDILKPEFNIMPRAGSHFGFKLSDESKEKIRQAKLGKKASGETKQKMSKAHKGRKITWGDKISKAQRNPSDEKRRKMSEAQKGKKHSEETKKNMSEAWKTRDMGYDTEEYRKKLSESAKKAWVERKKKLELTD